MSETTLTCPADRPSVMQFDAFAPYLEAVLANLRQNVKATGAGSASLRKIASGLGIKSPATLTMLSRGQRQPSVLMLRRLSRYFSWTASELLYAETLLAKAKATTAVESDRCQAELTSLRGNPAHRSTVINADLFTSTWYASIILEMFHLKDFRADPGWITERLDQDVTPKQVADILGVMQALGLLVAENGQLRPATTHFTTPSEVARKSLRNFHSAMLKRADKALRLQTIEERFFASQTLAIAASRVAEAKVHLDQMLDEFANKYAAPSGDEVYHCAVQFFRTTRQVRSSIDGRPAT